MDFADLIRITQIGNVSLKRPLRDPVEGIICITGHHLIFSPLDQSKENELWLQHSFVDITDFRPGINSSKVYLKLKNFEVLEFSITSAEDAQNMLRSVEDLCNIGDVKLRYPLFYRPSFNILEDGWEAFSLERELMQMTQLSDEWRLTRINEQFKVCATYPTLLIVPMSIDDDVLLKAAQFRQGHRFPVLSYLHPTTRACLLRSSQPLCGPNGKRNRDDERLLNAVVGSGRKGYILDTRAVTVQKQQQAKGGGSEPKDHYAQWKFLQASLERPSTLHDALVSFVAATNDVKDAKERWLNRLESCQWLSRVQEALSAACLAAQCIDNESAPVLIHGQEGIDTTLLVSSLAQVLLSSDARKVNGFAALIEREWVQGGHPFRSRHLKSAFARSESSVEAPMFLLFLDCVWQVMRQFPCSFEFNEQLLILLFEHSYSSEFGTFLCDNEKERLDYSIKLHTVSIWSYLLRPELLQELMNPIYEPNTNALWPSIAAQSVALWEGVFLRFQIDQSPKQAMWKEIGVIRDQDVKLRSKVNLLRRQLLELQKEAVENGLLTPSENC